MPLTASTLQWLPPARIMKCQLFPWPTRPWEMQPPVASPLVSLLWHHLTAPPTEKTLSPDLDHKGSLSPWTSSNLVSLERPSFPNHPIKQPLFLQTLPSYHFIFLHSTYYFLKISYLLVYLFINSLSIGYIRPMRDRCFMHCCISHA